jgi:hypothetical protein
VQKFLNRIVPGVVFDNPLLAGRADSSKTDGQRVMCHNAFPEFTAMRRKFFQADGWRDWARREKGGIGRHGQQHRGQGHAYFDYVIWDVRT